MTPHPSFIEPQLASIRRKRWTLVANQTGAIIYEGEPGRSFRFVARMTHQDPPKREQKARERVADQFARRIGKTLKRAASHEQFADLTVVAEPHFLGLLRRALAATVRSRISFEIPREFAQGSDQELEEYLLKKIAH